MAGNKKTLSDLPVASAGADTDIAHIRAGGTVDKSITLLKLTEYIITKLVSAVVTVLQLKTDTIDEKTTNAGVTIDGLVIKDGTFPELTNARDYHSTLQSRLRSDSKITRNALITGGVVSQNTVPNMAVAVSAGEAIVDGVACKWSTTSSPTFPSFSARTVFAVVINSNNTISIVKGVEDDVLWKIPSVATTQLAIAYVLLDGAGSPPSIDDGAIYANLSNVPGGVYVFDAPTASAATFGEFVWYLALACQRTGDKIPCSGWIRDETVPGTTEAVTSCAYIDFASSDTIAVHGVSNTSDYGATFQVTTSALLTPCSLTLSIRFW